MNSIGRLVRARAADEAWRRGLNIIWRQGAEIEDERGSRTKELMNLMVVVEDASSCVAPREYSWTEERLDEYASQLLSPENPGFEYTYGERLRSWNGEVDQIAVIINRLRKNPGTRRATAVTWIPPVDHRRDEVPCMVVCDFKIRSGRLNLTVMFRSHDFAGAYPANVYALTRLLRYVSEETGTAPGSITTLSASAHIYEHDWDWVESMIVRVGERQAGL
ncbi:MAG: thymidylate synthase [Methanothrix sp.]|uniref:thymidylate synthase n=1 Tax=Methanothrix sp. TaxID=90426 RepID=UPI0032AF7926|nr:thymidylate synthase [Methanothrix sp.]